MTCKEAVTVFCDGATDGCKQLAETGLNARTPNEAREDARKLGWVVRDMDDLCPVCKQGWWVCRCAKAKRLPRGMMCPKCCGCEGDGDNQSERCDMICSHRDQCTLMLGHDPGHNFRVCDCNGPLRSLAEVAAFEELCDALLEAVSKADPATLLLMAYPDAAAQLLEEQGRDQRKGLD